MKRRFILLVIDGLGVGEMADVSKERPQDKGAHTLKNILLKNPTIKLINFKKMKILDYFLFNKFRKTSYLSFNLSLGKFNLAHFGADSYMGHQEIAGTFPKKPKRQFVREEKDEILRRLKKDGFFCQFIKDKNIILVAEHIAVADNIETDYGLNINVVGSLDFYPFSLIEKVGRIVRKVVKLGRVITMGGVGISRKDFFRCLEFRTRDGFSAWGINIPRLNIYNEKYQVVHLGYGVNKEKQIPQILRRKRIKVFLIGKTADIIRADKAIYLPEVWTENVFNKIINTLQSLKTGLVFATVQETDLAGHEQDIIKYSSYLELIDYYLVKILKELKDNDAFLITGDHGNDPTVGHAQHTREKTPLILFSKSYSSQNLGERSTLSDTAASIANFFSVTSPENGKSFL